MEHIAVNVILKQKKKSDHLLLVVEISVVIGMDNTGYQNHVRSTVAIIGSAFQSNYIIFYST